MKCPFELPVQPEKIQYKESYLELYRISGLIFPYTKEEVNYIVQAINSYGKRYREGYEDGLRAYAWWKDGVEYVGSCGTTLKQALKQVEKL